METAVLLRVPLPLAEQLHKQLADKEARTASVAAAAAAAAASGGAAAAAAAAAAAKEKDKDDKGPSIRLHFSGGPTGAVTLMPSGSSSASGGGSGGPLTGQLVNLPSVLEIHKTFNNELFYKVTDVGQMIVVQAAATPATPGAAAAAGGAPSLNANPARPKNASADMSAPPPPPPVDFPSGLTPPTRDIRSMRYERKSVTRVGTRIVREVESIIENIRDNKPVHQFELVEDEEEVPEGEDSEMEQEQEEYDEQEESQQYEEEEGGAGAPMTGSDTGAMEAAAQSPAAAAVSVERPPSRQHTPGGLLQTPSHRTLASPNVLLSSGGQPPSGGAGAGLIASATPTLSNRLASPAMQIALASPAREDLLPTSSFQQAPRTGARMSSLFASPAVHAPTDADMADVTLDVAPAAAAAQSAAAAATTAAPPSRAAINVDSIEHMFGVPAPQPIAPFMPPPPIPAAAAAPAAAASAAEAAPAAAAVPASAADLHRAQMSELSSRVERARREVDEAKNMLLKRKAQQALDKLLEEQKTLLAAQPPP